jgi:hypothetical protein
MFGDLPTSFEWGRADQVADMICRVNQGLRRNPIAINESIAAAASVGS